MIRFKKGRPLVNMLMVFRVIGWLLMIEAAFMLIPLVVALATQGPDVKAFVVTFAATVVAGGFLTFLLPRSQYDMSKRDGFMLTALVWVFFSLFGMIPFMFEPLGMSAVDAFFETMSGFSTTGATLLDGTKGAMPTGIIIWRCLIQWIGGMGIIIFTLAVLPMLNSSGGVQMFNAEVTGITHDKLRPRVSQTAKGLWGIYISLTTILFVLLWLGPMDFFESLCQAFSIMSTGGYVPAYMDLSEYDSSYLDVTATVFMFLGGVNFGLIFSVVTGNYKAPWRNEVFRTYVITIAVMYVLFVAGIVAAGQFDGLRSVTIEPIFIIVSMMSSTGYVNSAFVGWGAFVMSLSLLMMFFGACAGSTSGGAKLDRLLYLVKSLRNELYRGLHPNSIQSVKISGKMVPPDLVGKVLAFLCLYVVMIIGGGVALTAVGCPLYDAFFASFSSISNSGLIPGITGYGNTYLEVPEAGRLILSMLMMIGRLEVFTVVLIFSPAFWNK